MMKSAELIKKYRVASGKILTPEQQNVIIDSIEQNIIDVNLHKSISDFLTSQKTLNVKNVDSQRIFALLANLLENCNIDICKGIINDVSYIEGYEKEKWQLLIKYFVRTTDKSVFNTFFYQYKDPQFLFWLISDSYQETRSRAVVSWFSNSISHFFRVNRLETEKWLLKFFEPDYKLGTLPLDILLDQKETIDLLQLKTENAQIEAVRKFQNIYFQFDRLLPLLLRLRKSTFPDVVIGVQYCLSELIIESYGSVMIGWIEKEIGDDINKPDEIRFMTPIKEAVKIQKIITDKRLEFNDLNPSVNERNLVELYYSLEHEEQAKSISDMHESEKGLMHFFGTNTKSIVRGNSFKIEGQDKITPLGLTSSEITYDLRLYKNPDLFEYNVKKHH